MKRSGPPVRRTPLMANPDKQRAWADRSRKGLAQRSAKARSRDGERAAAMDIVRRRAGHRCEARDLVPGVRCGSLGQEWSAGEDHSRELHGHEPLPRSQGGDPTDPDQILLVCPHHHEWAHHHPAAASAVGLRKWGSNRGA